MYTCLRHVHVNNQLNYIFLFFLNYYNVVDEMNVHFINLQHSQYSFLK
jgi:hypothetical protein